MTPPVVVAISLAIAVVLAVWLRQTYRRRRGQFRSDASLKLVKRMRDQRKTPNIESQAADVTVVFTNIIDFVGMFEREGDLRAVEMVNLYREAMTPIVRRYKGYLNKFIGDKMMIVFNTPINRDEDHCTSAVQMTLKMQEALDDLNQRLEKAGRPRLMMTIGMASGLAVVGDAGSTAASDYTVMGDVVNIAARLERACKGAGRRNLIGVETVSRLGDRFTLTAVTLTPTPLTPAMAYEATARSTAAVGHEIRVQSM